MASSSRISIVYKPIGSMSEIPGFTILEKLYKGGNGTIYKGVDIQTQEQVALKYSKFDLSNEYKIMKKLQRIQGIPKIYQFGEQGRTSFMSMEFLSHDLHDLSLKIKQFSLKTICLIAIKLLETLREVHQQNIVHRDIKPTNLMIKSYEDEQIYLVDFGIAKFVNQYTSQREINGTPIFDPIQTHKKQQYRYIDDIEMLAYTLTSFYYGNLPWAKYAAQVTASDQVWHLKEKFMNSKKMTSLPFSELFGYIKWNQNTNMPNYDFLISLFKKLLQNNKLQEDYIYDWRNRDSTPISSSKKTTFVFFKDYLPSFDHQTDLQEEEDDVGACQLNQQFYRFFTQ